MTDEEILRRRQVNEEYWQARARLEEKWMKANLADDAAFNKVIEDYYQKALQGIAKSLSDQYTRFAGRDGLTMDEAKEKVKSTDIKDYEQEAADLVERSKQIFKKKGSVDYSDFSDEENEHMRLYNATMRINRLEYLKSQIGLEMVDSGMKLSKAFGDKLGSDYIAEVKRQAGILALNLDPTLLDNKNVLKQIFMNPNPSDVSHRLWANQDALKARLDIGLTNMLIQGWNPNKMAGDLKKMLSSEFKKATYATQRLARTESARVQFAAQMDSFNKYGFDYVQWHAEPSACKDCQYIAESGKEGKGIYKIDDVPSIPAHPNCRCSVSAYYSQKELDTAMEKTGSAKMPQDSKDQESSFNPPFDKTNKQSIIDYINNVLKAEYREAKGNAANTELLGDGISFIAQFNKEFSNFAKKAEKIPLFEVVSPREAKKTVAAYIKSGYEQTPVKMLLNGKYFKDPKILREFIERNVASGFYSNNKSPLHVFAHEYGHYVSSQLSLLTDDSGFEDRFMRGVMSKYSGQQYSDRDTFLNDEKKNVDKIGRYGLSNQSEAFAELFSAWRGDTPNDLARLFGQELIKVLRKV